MHLRIRHRDRLREQRDAPPTTSATRRRGAARGSAAVGRDHARPGDARGRQPQRSAGAAAAVRLSDLVRRCAIGRDASIDDDGAAYDARLAATITARLAPAAAVVAAHADVDRGRPRAIRAVPARPAVRATGERHPAHRHVASAIRPRAARRARRAVTAVAATRDIDRGACADDDRIDVEVEPVDRRRARLERAQPRRVLQVQPRRRERRRQHQPRRPAHVQVGHDDRRVTRREAEREIVHSR